MIIFYIILAFYTDIKKVSETIVKIDYITLSLAFILQTICLFFFGLRFHIFVRSLKINVPLRRSILIYLTGLSFSVTPGSIGQLIKSHIIKKEFGSPVSKTAPILLVEKWHELVSALIILAFLMCMEDTPQILVIFSIGTIIAALLVTIMKNKKIFFYFKKITKVRFLNRFDDIISNSQESIGSLMNWRMFFGGLILTLTATILESLAVFFTFEALNIKLSFVKSTEVFFTSVIAGVISFIPGGILITEGSMLSMLSGYGIELSLAATAIIFVRLITLWYSTLLGFVVMRSIGKSKDEVKLG